ncbi:hypothetical protein BH10ACT2_BH10ACT2_15130 [soil metagenome]
MAAIFLRASSWLRRYGVRLVLTAAVIGLLGGLLFGLVAGTRRTNTAADRYTGWAGGDPDLAITQQGGPPLTAEIGAIPGVVQAQSWTFVASFLLAPDDGSVIFDPNSFAGTDSVMGTRVVEGRFTDPSHPDEFTVNRSFAAMLEKRFGTHVGDTFQVTSFDQQQIATNAFDSGEPPAVPLFTVTLVGITQSPSEVEDPAQNLVFSEGFLAAHPDVGVVQTLIAAYLESGTDRATVVDAVHALPNGADAYNVPTRIISPSARRAVGFQVAALWLVVAIAALAAAAAIAMIVSRMLRLSSEERLTLKAFGWRQTDVMAGQAAVGAVAALVAAPIAVVSGYLISAQFPLGVLGKLEPDPGRRMDWQAATYVVIALSVVVLGGAVAGGLHRVRSTRAARPVGALGRLIEASPASMPLIAAAALTRSDTGNVRSRPGRAVIGALGLAGVVGSIVVGLSLGQIGTSPARWGANFDQLFGNPYVPTDSDIAAPMIAAPGVESVTAATIGSLSVNGHDTATFAFDPVKGSLLPVAIRGRAPLAAGEIGLGAEVARRLGVGVGDVVTAVGATGVAAQQIVVGIVVTPDTAGGGAAMTFASFATLNPTATENIVLVDFLSSAPPDAANAIAEANFTPPGALPKPPSLAALSRVTSVPFMLTGLLVILLLAAFMFLLASSIRIHRNNLIVLRALGSNRRQRWAVIQWHATLIAIPAVCIGVPAGIIIGRQVVALVTDALGIVPGSLVPIWLIASATIGTLAIANLLALAPGYRVARSRATERTVTIGN